MDESSDSPLNDTEDEWEAGSTEPFQDPLLYDWEYRRRRNDIRFYRTLAAERGGPILDLGCGTGRLLLPLLRDGHVAVGMDRSRPMLARAAERVRRLSATRRARALLVQGDFRSFAFGPRTGRRGQGQGPFPLAICAFHSVQHLYTEEQLLTFFKNVRRCLTRDGWFVFDVLPPDPRWFALDPNRRWARTVFRHPRSKERLVYTTNHRYDPNTRVLHMKIYYQPVNERLEPNGPEQVVRLNHRQVWPEEARSLLRKAGFRTLAIYGGFDGRFLDGECDEHIYLAQPLPSGKTNEK